jgi:hypothetical protein
MPAKDKDQLGEYEAAMLLPRTMQTEMLHHYAMEYQQGHGGPHLEGALRTAQLIRERWEHDLPRVGEEGFRPFVGTREATRCCVLAESLQRKLIDLRNRAYRWARAKLFHLDGVRIDFPTWPDTDAEPAIEAVIEAAEPASQTAASAEPAPVAAQEAPGERLVAKREVKAVMQRLHNAGVKGADLQAFKQRCMAGNVTESQMRQWAQELLAAAPAA